MVDQADDLRLLRPAEGVTPHAADLFPSGPQPALPPVSSRVPAPPGPGGQPVHAPALPLQTDQLVGSRDQVVEPRKLTVGQGVSLSGEITHCDRLIIEGSVQANLHHCQNMTIAETGLFKGYAAIVDTEVSGRFEGELIVGKRLLIRASGHVSGTITYGEIEVEAGGKISGTIKAHERPKRSGSLAHKQLKS
jgi:cytoskeletal protein CcmA (bactofilin family)